MHYVLGAKSPDCIVDSCRLAIAGSALGENMLQCKQSREERRVEEEAGGEMGSNLGIIGGARGGGMGVRGR